MAGRWEFPGGKVNAGETEADALTRELREELGIEVTSSRPFMRLAHSYDDRDVELSMWIVEHFTGAPQSLDGQRLKWVQPARLFDEDILEADRPFVEALRDRQCTMQANSPT
jgi:8-oxo-dGTP diphosphatase